MLPALLPALAIAWSWPSLDRPVEKSGLGRDDAALVVGIADYVFLPDIAGADGNATDWYRWLTEARGVPPEHVRLLRNAEATREEVLDAAARSASEVGDGGTLWVVFIGHGAPAPGGEDGLLLGADAQRTENSLRARAIAQKDLLALAGTKRVLAVFDACFSGMAADGVTPLVPGSQATLPVRRVGARDGLVVLSSSDEVAGPLPGHDRPAFSYVLLGALRGWGDKDDDASVTLDEAFAYTRATLVATVKGRNQTPTLRGIAQGVVLAQNATERGPDIAAATLIVPAPALAAPVQPVAPQAAVVPAPAATQVALAPLRAEAQAVEQRVLEERYQLAALHRVEMGGRQVWVRGIRDDTVDDQTLISLGRATAPKAAELVDLLAPREPGAVTPMLTDTIVGAGTGLGIGVLLSGGVLALMFASGDGGDAFDSGALALYGGLSAVSLLGGVGVGAGIGVFHALDQLDASEQQQLDDARGELAAAANRAERERLKLSAR